MNSEIHPLVSIIIPVYNGSNYMRDAIDSALAQTYPNIEILVINDGSADNGATHEIAMSYGKKIRYFQKENGGVVSALNFGIDHMRGEYFAWLSHDDLYRPEKIEKQVLALKKHEGTRPAFCVCNCTFINEKSEEMYRSYISEDCAFDKPLCFLFLGNVGFNGIMVLIPKKLFDQCGKFTPSLATHEYDMWLRLMDVADVVVEPESLTCMRIHSHQVSKLKKQAASIETDNFMRNGMQKIPYPDFETFVMGQIAEKGIGYIFGILNSYMWYQDLPLTSVQVLKHVRLLCENAGNQIDEIYSFLIGHSHIEEIKACFTKRLQSSKQLNIIYCDNLTDDVFKHISTGLALLSAQVEVVVLYRLCSEHNLQLLRDISITPIVMDGYDWYMPIRLSLLCYLLRTKMFWYYSNDNLVLYPQVFHYLNIMEISSLASFHNVESFFMNTQNSDHASFAEQKKNISEASVITSHMAPSASGFLYFQNMIVVPENDLLALVRWKAIFDVLLAASDFGGLKNRITGSLSAIMEKTNVSLAEYVNDYVKDFIVALDSKTAALISTYEQRRFWKLTKPLRSCVWFVRKANKAVKRVIKREESLRSIISRMRLMLKNRRIAA